MSGFSDILARAFAATVVVVVVLSRERKGARAETRITIRVEESASLRLFMDLD
jgi:hypothetical protein